MDAIEKIIKLISDYGFVIVAAGFFLYTVLKDREQQKKRTEYELEQQRRDNEARSEREKQYNDLILSLARGGHNPNHAEEDKTNNKFNVVVNDILVTGLADSGADRALVFSYHNGGSDYTGRGFQKMSCTNEVVRPGVKPIQAKYQNMFRNTMYTLYCQLMDVGYFNIVDTKELKENDAGFYQLTTDDDVYSLFGCHILNRDAQVIGFIVFTFDETHTTEQSQHIVSVLKTTRNRMDGLYRAYQDGMIK